jgi:hypothetical protein
MELYIVDKWVVSLPYAVADNSINIRYTFFIYS